MSDRCFCGAGVYRDGDGSTIRSHAPDCLWLAWVAALEADGVCGCCGETYQVQRGQGWRRRICQTCKTESYERWM